MLKKLKIGAIIIALILINPISYMQLNTANAQTSGSYSEYTEEGMASWYGPGFQGRKTASGETFNTNDLTAAHKTLPFNTLLKVTNLENGKQTIVRVNDRGPYARGRIIDLSNAAKKEIEMGGLARVRIELYIPSEETTKPEITHDLTPYNLFEDVIPSNSKVFVEFNKDDLPFEKNRSVTKESLKQILNTFKKIKLVVLINGSEDAETSQIYKNADIEKYYYEISNRVNRINGYSLELISDYEIKDVDELIGKLESANLDTVFVVKIVSKDSSNLKIFVGNYKNDDEIANGKKIIEELGYKTRLVIL